MTREELILKTKTAKSVEELLALAKENDIAMDEESAKAYFDQINKIGELADDELDNVSGGWCYNGGRPVITEGEHHDCYVCNDPFCKARGKDGGYSMMKMQYSHWCNGYLTRNVCANCKYIVYEKGLWLCDNPDNRK